MGYGQQKLDAAELQCLLLTDLNKRGDELEDFRVSRFEP